MSACGCCPASASSPRHERIEPRLSRRGRSDTQMARSGHLGIWVSEKSTLVHYRTSRLRSSASGSLKSRRSQGTTPTFFCRAHLTHLPRFLRHSWRLRVNWCIRAGRCLACARMLQRATEGALRIRLEANSMSRWIRKRWVWAALAGVTMTVGFAGRGDANPPQKVGDVITLNFEGKGERKFKVLKSDRQPDGNYLTELKDIKTGEQVR